jgi:hypothetical protein
MLQKNVSARNEKQGVLLRCPHCKFRQRVDTGLVAAAIRCDGKYLECVACKKPFAIVVVGLTRAAEQRDEAGGELAGKAPKNLSTEDDDEPAGEPCLRCKGVGSRYIEEELTECPDCNGTGQG